MINILEISKIPGLQGAGIEGPVANTAPETGGDAKPGFDSLIDLAMPQPVAIPGANGLPESGKTLPVTGGTRLPDAPGPTQGMPRLPLPLPDTTDGVVRVTLPETGDVGNTPATSPAKAPTDDIRGLIDRLAKAMAQTAPPKVPASDPVAAKVENAIKPMMQLAAPQPPVLSEAGQDVLRQIRAPSAVIDQIAVRYAPVKSAESLAPPTQVPNVNGDSASLLQVASSPVPFAAMPTSGAAQTTPAQYLTTQPVQNTPHAFETLVDRLVEARESARPVRAEMSVGHDDFGRITLRMDNSAMSGGLRVALSSPDPDFAPVAQAALADRASSDRSPSDGDRPQADQARQDMQNRHNGEHARGGDFADAQRQYDARAAREAHNSGERQEDDDYDARDGARSLSARPDESGLFA